MHSLPAAAVLQAEHESFVEQLGNIAATDGPLGAAASDLMGLVLPHTAREESLAMPLLGLLPSLATGAIDTHHAPFAALAHALRAALPHMLEEHIAIVGAARRLLEMAEETGHADAARLADQLIRHAGLEEDVLYPAAIVAGDYLALRLRQEMVS